MRLTSELADRLRGKSVRIHAIRVAPTHAPQVAPTWRYSGDTDELPWELALRMPRIPRAPALPKDLVALRRTIPSGGNDGR